MSERITVVLEDGVSEMLIELAGSSRKQGEYLSGLIRAAYVGNIEIGAGADLEQLKLGFAGLAGKQKEIEGRVIQVERQVSTLLSRV